MRIEPGSSRADKSRTAGRSVGRRGAPACEARGKRKRAAEGLARAGGVDEDEGGAEHERAVAAHARREVERAEREVAGSAVRRHDDIRIPQHVLELRAGVERVEALVPQ